MAPAITFISERDQILKVDTPVRARAVIGDLSCVVIS
jgi:hypothetical protein